MIAVPPPLLRRFRDPPARVHQCRHGARWIAGGWEEEAGRCPASSAIERRGSPSAGGRTTRRAVGPGPAPPARPAAGRRGASCERPPVDRLVGGARTHLPPAGGHCQGCRRGGGRRVGDRDPLARSRPRPPCRRPACHARVRDEAAARGRGMGRPPRSDVLGVRRTRISGSARMASGIRDRARRRGEDRARLARGDASAPRCQGPTRPPDRRGEVRSAGRGRRETAGHARSRDPPAASGAGGHGPAWRLPAPRRRDASVACPPCRTCVRPGLPLT